MSDDDESHALAPFLTERLPQLGLDYETYGPYVLPLLTENEVDPDEWESVMELLQASSETHSGDEEAWKLLRNDIEVAWKNHQTEVQEQQAQLKEEQANKLKEEIEREREIAEKAAAQVEPKEPVVTDEARQALMARFGYDIPPEEEEESGPVNNKEAAAQAKAEQTRELRANKGVSKKEEQQKTAQAKQQKVKAKEDRRARATKSERRR